MKRGKSKIEQGPDIGVTKKSLSQMKRHRFLDDDLSSPVDKTTTEPAIPDPVTVESQDVFDLLLPERASRAMYAAAEETMAVVGYNVIAEDGWVVKVYADGRRQKIKPISHKTDKQ